MPIFRAVKLQIPIGAPSELARSMAGEGVVTPRLVVGIGASAGGLEALEVFIRAVLTHREYDKGGWK